MICLCYVHIVDMDNCNNEGPTSSFIQSQPIDPLEKRRQQYAQMSKDKKNEELARRRAAYQQKKLLAGKDDIFNMTKYMYQYYHGSLPERTLSYYNYIMSFYQSKLKLNVQGIGSIMLICLLKKRVQRRLSARYGAIV